MQINRQWLAFAVLVATGAVGCGDNGANTDRDAQNNGEADSGAHAMPIASDAGQAGAPNCAPRSELSAVLSAYGAAWNDDSVETRDCLLMQALVGNAIYVDPTTDARDRSALSSAIGQFRKSMNGASIVLTGDPMARTRDVLVTWDFELAGAKVLSGVDYMELADNGQLRSIQGYWEPIADGKPIDAVTAYIAAWNASDAGARDTALAAACARDIVLRSAEAEADGVAQVASAIAAARKAGLASVTKLMLQSYGVAPTHARVQLQLTDATGATGAVTDYLRFNESGLIERVGRFAEP